MAERENRGPLGRARRTIRDFGNRTVAVKWILPAYVILAGSITGAIWRFDYESRARQAEALAEIRQSEFVNRLTDYRSCTARVSARDDLRGQFLRVYALIEASNERNEGIVELARVELDLNYPAYPAGYCGVDPALELAAGVVAPDTPGSVIAPPTTTP